MLSWNEIRQRTIEFAKDWAGAKREKAESQSFWNDFFNVFGVKRRVVASFEEPVKKLSGDWGYIDLFWPGTLLAEHKSFGKSLDKAKSQGMEYIRALKDNGREDEIPRYLIISDFAHIALYDLEAAEESKSSLSFPLQDFYKHAHHFVFIAGYKEHKLDAEDPVNLKAVSYMCELHDTLEAGGYTGHELRRFLVRILFCLFAEDTSIFPPQKFQIYLKDRTLPDGSDLGLRLAHLFEILNTPKEKRQKNLDEHLAEFPYVNGNLFEEKLNFANFNSDMRNALIACSYFDWSRISPAIFGSLFQSVMDPKERRQLGAHYTAEKNILKLVRSLFLDELRAEFEAIKTIESKKSLADRLDVFLEKLANLKFFDPACGCGNFLVITYRELRQLELEALLARYGVQREFTLDDVNKLSKIDVDQMYGIELEEFPARIAEVALWLMDHQMNVKLGQAFTQFYLRIPLRKSPHVKVGNALRLDWKEILSPEKCNYILGNPPFVGKKVRSETQQIDMGIVFGAAKGIGVLDYVSCWYLRAAQYIQNTRIKVAFVSTNSISQGEQPGILWPILFRDYKLKIHFAHRTFAWESEARGKAHVHVVIIGFAAFDKEEKFIYDYEKGKATVISVKNISPYLVEGTEAVLENREYPICRVPQMQFGSMPNDDGNFLLTDTEKKDLLLAEPGASPFIRPLLSAHEYLHGEKRWCLWLKDISPQTIRGFKEILHRVEAVQTFRTASKREATKKLANFPTLFGEIRQPNTKYILIPRHSSERRQYIPLSYFDSTYIVSDSCLFLPDATLFHFGVLSSEMHLAWVRQICGRIKSDFRYSNKLVYNNFPWPQDLTNKQREAIEEKAQIVLDARKEFSGATLADLYDPIAMPPTLRAAHDQLDHAVDVAYRRQLFTSERERLQFLLMLYEKITMPLALNTKKSRETSKRFQNTRPISRADIDE